MKTNYSSKLHNVFCKTRTSVIPSLYCFTKYIVQTSKLQHRAALLLVLFSIWSLSGAEAQAQNNVGIGTTTPNAKAILELNANDKGFLTPRMNTTQMNAIATAATENGLLVYNTDSACYHFYNGTVWKNLCQKGIDTAIINKAIKNYLSNVNFTTVINNMLVDSSVTNYAVINNAIVNNITIDSSVINYTTINNAVINNLTVDSSSINFTTINNAVINNLTVDSSATNYASINNAVIDSSITNMATINNANINVLKVDSSVTNYSNINNAVIDSSVTNYSQVAHLKGGWGSMDSLQIGGKNIMQTMSDSIKSQAWLLKGNAGTNASANFIGTTDNSSLRIRTNNTERMIVDNTTGNVGVGLNNPIAKLQVNTNRANGSVVPIMAYDSIFKTGTSIFGWTPGIGFNYHHSGASPQVIKGDNYAGEINFTPADGKMYFKVWNKAGATNTSFVNTTVKGIPMVIDSNLNVGIGTTTPTKTLDVNGDVQLSGNLFFGNGNVRTQTRLDAGLATSLGAQSGFYDNDGLSVVNYPAGATSWWHLIEARHSSTLNTMAMQIAGSHYDQDLWFRKTNNNPAQPWSKILAVSGTNSSLGWLTNGNSNTSSATNFIGTTDAQDFVFKTNNTENMRITNGGYVGIGSATPAQKLSVEGGNIQVGELIPAIGVGRDLIFGDQFSNSDAIHFVRENIGLNLSKLTLVLGDDYGATIANDQFNIEATNSPIPVLSVHTGTISVGVGTNAPAYRLHVLDGHAASTSSDGLASALLSPDGCVELFRNRVSTPNGKAYIDFKDNASDDLDFRIEQYNPLGSVANQVLNYYSPLSPRTLSMRNDNGFIGMGLNFDLHSAETRLHIVEDNMAQGITNDLLLLDHYHNNADWTPILQRNARGTEAAPANLQTNDALGGLLMIGRAGGVNSIMSYINSNYSGNGSTVSSNLFFGTSALNRVMIDQLGNVGIGTMSPAQRLTIEGGDVQIGEIMPVTGVGRRLMFTDIGNSTDAMFFQRENIVLDASNLNLYIGDNQGSGPTVSDKFNVMTTNNAMPIFTVDAGTYSVGIGNTDPLATLDLRGPVKYAFAAGTGAGSDGPSRAIIPAADGGSRMNDWPNGWGGGLSTWDIVGSSAFFFNYIIRSDERLKKDIVTMNTNITESYMQLRPVTYLLKKQTPETEGLHYGFIAQEVAKLFPSIVTKDSGLEGATIGMNYQALIAPTVHVVQEQQNTITNLQTQLQELSRKLDEQNKLLQLLMQDRK